MAKEEEELFEEYSLPDGSFFYAPQGTDPSEVEAEARRQRPDLFYMSLTPPRRERPTPQPQPQYEDREQGFLDTFGSSFAASLERGVKGIPAGLSYMKAEMTGDEAALDAAAAEVNRISGDANKRITDPSSWEKVKDEFSRGGLLPAAGEILDLAAQGLGGSFGYMAPSMAVVLGTAAAGVSAPWVAAAALGSAGLLRFTQYFSEQFETSYNEAARSGDVDLEDIDLANQVLSAAGQALLESSTYGVAGVFGRIGKNLSKNVAKSALVKDASNKAMAKTLLDAATNANRSRLAVALRTMGTEIVEEQGQNLFQRLAAGQSIDPDDQGAWDAYVETFIQTVLTAGAFGAGAAALHIPTAPVDAKMKDPESEEEPAVEAGMSGDIPDGPSLTPQDLARRALEAQSLQSDLAGQARVDAEQEAERQVKDIEQAPRQIGDVINLMNDRNIDFKSDDVASSGFAKFIYDQIGKVNLGSASAAEVEKVYEALASVPKSESAVVLPLSSDTEAITKGKELSKRNPYETKEDFIKRIKKSISKESSEVTNSKYDGLRANAIYDHLQRNGLIEIKKGKMRIDKKAVKMVSDKEFQGLVESVLDMTERPHESITPTGGWVDRMGEFPTWERVKSETGLDNRNTYEQVKDFLIRRGMIKKETDANAKDRVRGKFYRTSLLPDSENRDASPLHKRKERSRTKAVVKRFVVYDQDGKVVPNGIFKNKGKAQSFVRDYNTAETRIYSRPDAVNTGVYQEPVAERGYVIKETTYKDQNGKERVVKSIPVDFVPLSSSDPVARADEIVESLNAQQALLDPDSRPDFLSGVKSEGEDAKLNRLVRANKGEQRHEAVRRLTESPVSFNTKLHQYGLGTSLSSDSSLELNDGEVFGEVSLGIFSEKTSKPVDVVIKEGHVLEDGRGFGRARLDTQNETIQAETKFNNWQGMVYAFFGKLKANPKILTTGEVTVVNEGPGRTVLIWNEPTHEMPMGFVLDHYQEGDTQKFHLYNAWGGNSYQENLDDFGWVRGLDPRRGNPSAEAVNAAHSKKRVKRMTLAERFKHSVSPPPPPGYGGDGGAGGSGGSSGGGGQVVLKQDGQTIAVVEAGKMRKLTDEEKEIYKPKTLISRISAAYNYWKRDPKGAARLRFEIFDNVHEVVMSDTNVRFKDTDGPLHAEARAETAARMIDQGIHMYYAQLNKGVPSYKRLDPSSPMNGVFRPQEITMQNSSEGSVVWLPGASAPTTRKFVANLFNKSRKNTIGGLQTVYQAAAKPDGNLVPKLKEYMQALRAWNLATDGGTVAFGEGRRVPDSIEKVKSGLSILNDHPEVAVLHRNLQDINDAMVQFLVETSVLSQEEANLWTQYRDYVPFYLNMSAEANEFIAEKWEKQQEGRMFKTKLTAMRNFDPTIAYKGIGEMTRDFKAEDVLLDPVEAAFRNGIGITVAGTRNVAVLRAIRNEIVDGAARLWRAGDEKDSTPVVVKEDGKEVQYYVEDPLMHETLTGSDVGPMLEMLMKTPAADWLAKTPAQFLRETVVRNPGFMIPNVAKDSLSVWMINGGNPNLMLKVWGRIAKNAKAAILNDEEGYSATYKILRDFGITSGYEHFAVSGTPTKAAIEMNKDLNRRAEGKERRNFAMRAWDAMGRVSIASESATREIVYETVYKNEYKRLTASGMTREDAEVLAQAEAVEQAKEILNFSRRGNSTQLRLITSAAPFVQARINGIDVFARAGLKYAPVGYNRATPNELANSLKRRGLYVAGISTLMAMMNYGDDEYEREPGHRRDDNWFWPIYGLPNSFTYPIPFELGVFFKVIPEQMVRSVMKTMNGEADAAGRDAMRAFGHAFSSNFAFGSIVPVALRPFLELATNRNMHTDAQIDPYWEVKNADPADRYGPETSAQARVIGSVTGNIPLIPMSPRHIDNMVGTLGGGLATSVWGALDFIFRYPANFIPDWFGLPPKPTPGIRDIVLLRRLISDPGMATGDLGEYHDFMAKMEKVHWEVNRAASRGIDIRQKKARELRAREALKPVGKAITKLRKREDELMQNMQGLGSAEINSRRRQLREQLIAPLNRYKQIRKQLDQMD